MDKEFTIEDVIMNKKGAIRSLNGLLESYINSNDEDLIKKANLLSYWIKSYSRYIKEESEFIPTKQIAYKRGNVIKLNFGFNIGAEYGGLHYAIVMDIKNDHSSPCVTVIPLTSGTEENTYHTDIFLGNELYTKVKDRQEKIISGINKKIKEIQSLFDTVASASQAITTVLKQHEQQKIYISDRELLIKLQDLEKQQQVIEKKMQQYKTEKSRLIKVNSELEHMKSGSIALMKQITTVSKARIYTPKKKDDSLFGISISTSNMKKINDKFKELYVK